MKKIIISLLISMIFLSSCGEKPDFAVLDSETETYVAEESYERTITVYVCGCVERPGVYDIPEGSRVKDALTVAGGVTELAAPDFVNLAKLVSDSEKIYFPSAEEISGAGETSTGMVNINIASVDELKTLPGIGDSKANDIVAYREENGGFSSIEDIMKIAGIKETLYNKIKDRIIV